MLPRPSGATDQSGLFKADEAEQPSTIDISPAKARKAISQATAQISHSEGKPETNPSIHKAFKKEEATSLGKQTFQMMFSGNASVDSLAVELASKDRAEAFDGLPPSSSMDIPRMTPPSSKGSEVFCLEPEPSFKVTVQDLKLPAPSLGKMETPSLTPASADSYSRELRMPTMSISNGYIALGKATLDNISGDFVIHDFEQADTLRDRQGISHDELLVPLKAKASQAEDAYSQRETFPETETATQRHPALKVRSGEISREELAESAKQEAAVQAKLNEALLVEAPEPLASLVKEPTQIPIWALLLGGILVAAISVTLTILLL